MNKCEMQEISDMIARDIERLLDAWRRDTEKSLRDIRRAIKEVRDVVSEDD